MNISLSSHFTLKKLIRFTLPSIYMMIFTSMYTIVDGFFVSNYAGKTALAAITLIYPVIMIISAIGFMFGTGGTAIIGKFLGEKKEYEAKSFFSLIILLTFVLGAVFAIGGLIFLKPLAIMLGAEGEILLKSMEYARILLYFIPMFMVQCLFQSFFVVADKPKLGFYVTLFSGIVNIILDYFFIGLLSWDIAGAAFATGIGQFFGAIIPIFYFSRKNKSLLQIVKPRFRWNLIWKAATNGFSEFLSSIASSGLSVVYNFQIIRYAGENGLAAYGVIGYVSFLFISISLGYSIGVAPIISYNYGAENHAELSNVYKKSRFISFVTSFTVALLCLLFAETIGNAFVGYNMELKELTVKGLRIFSLGFILSGYNIFVSSFFTALNNGLISAVISVLRQLVFALFNILLLPHLFGITGVWAAFFANELLTFGVSLLFIAGNRKRYHY